MKTTILVLLILISNLAYSQITVSAQTGDWNVSSTWVGGVVPGGGDSIVINNGHIVTILADNTISPTGAVQLAIFGVLNFEKKAHLDLDAGSTLYIRDAASSITASTGNADISIGGVLQWQSTGGGQLVGTHPDIIELGASFPIELIDYRIKENIFLFTTASQENVERFVIELYDENMNYIGELYEMPCNCLMIMEYIVPIENADVRYLRLVEYDYNGERVDFNFLHIQGQKDIDVSEENIFYTMDGKMLRSTYQELKPGVYIHNGKKVMKASSESY